MAKIVTKAIRRTYKTLIKQVISDLGEPLSVYGTPEEDSCPNCHYDRVTRKSKNIYDTSFVVPVTIFDELITPQPFNRSRCPVCSGEGKLFNLAPKIVRGIVKWVSQDTEMENTVAGKEGSNLVRVKSRVSSYAVMRDCQYAVIDGVRCELFTPPRIRGLGQQDELVISFFQAVEVGHNIKV
jgi:hypothetical protein